MKQMFTDEDIIRFLYNEMGYRETEVFLDALYKDDSLWERYEAFQHIVDKLDDVQMEPSKEACDNIMRYVEETAPVAEKKKAFAFVRVNNTQRNAILMVAFVLFASVTIMVSVFNMKSTQTSYQETAGAIEPVVLEWDDNSEEQLQVIRKQVDNLRTLDDKTLRKL